MVYSEYMCDVFNGQQEIVKLSFIIFVFIPNVYFFYLNLKHSEFTESTEFRTKFCGCPVNFEFSLLFSSNKVQQF